MRLLIGHCCIASIGAFESSMGMRVTLATMRCDVQYYFLKLGLPDKIAELLARKGTYDNVQLDAETLTAVQ
jgi:hypothetical protein